MRMFGMMEGEISRWEHGRDTYEGPGTTSATIDAMTEECTLCIGR